MEPERNVNRAADYGVDGLRLVTFWGRGAWHALTCRDDNCSRAICINSKRTLCRLLSTPLSMDETEHREARAALEHWVTCKDVRDKPSYG